MDFARLIRAARRRREVSQRELAELAGLPRTTIARIEAGRVEPRLRTFLGILAALGFELAVTDGNGVLELDDEQDALRDRAGRRFPAHLKAFKTPRYFSINKCDWWGWERIAWPFGPGEPPEYTFWHRPKRY
ncbi:MAG TPA: helix-turn-helix transcriptional regulator [Jatrophihabitans sp.]|jgi:transcriptional regulator with XRE-family HTH domain|nr:helix-turn-helix transcriptional regulator [Jatrophihabitans sp.]